MQVECPHCGFSREVPKEKIPFKATVARCPKCGQKFSFRAGAEEQPAEEDKNHDQRQNEAESNTDIWSRLESLQTDGSDQQDQADQGQAFWEVPWENLHQHGFFPGLSLTIKLVLLAPVQFFNRMPLGRGFTMPLIFYLLIAELQILSIFFWRMAGLLPRLEQETASMFGLALTGAGAFSLLIFYPLLMAGYIFFYSAVSHLCLLAVKSGQRGFEGTFKVIAYANAPMILGLLPVLGPWVGFFWSLVCTFFGFKLVHDSPGPRVLLAMLLPYLFILFLSLFLIGLGGGH